MKKVKAINNLTVEPKNVNNKKYYGFSVAPHKQDNKGFIARLYYKCDKYRAFSTYSLTEGNGYDQSDTLVGLVTKLEATEVFDVYEFDTSKELFEWLSCND